jgi:ubiquitin-activating enzyme E1
MPKFIDFEPLTEQLKTRILTSDFAKFDRPSQLHIGFQALHAFAESRRCAHTATRMHRKFSCTHMSLLRRVMTRLS